MVLFTLRFVGSERGDRRRDKLVQQHAACLRLRVITDNQNHHHRQHTAHQLAQRAVEELAEVERHRVIQHQNINGARQRAHRTKPSFLHFDADKKAEQRQADAQQQHTLLGRREYDQEVERAERQRGEHTVEEIERHHTRVRQAHRQRRHDRYHDHRAAARGPAGPEPEERAQQARHRGAPEVNHGVVTLRRRGFNHHFISQHIVFHRADFRVGDHAALEQQVTRGRADPGVNRHRRVMLAGPGEHAADELQATVHIGGGFHRLDKQLAVFRRYRLRTGVLDEIGFAGLGNERQGERIERFKAAIRPHPAR
ncbi:hypothetical protein BN132_2930 [Cronobacter turicensis 564]|nr:hypothetical protein BN132_2930 [Cronobacter turicensis 564]